MQDENVIVEKVNDSHRRIIYFDPDLGQIELSIDIADLQNLESSTNSNDVSNSEVALDFHLNQGIFDINPYVNSIPFSNTLCHDICAICQEQFSVSCVDIVEIINCKHLFCGNCLRKWLVAHLNCPLCMQSILHT